MVEDEQSEKSIVSEVTEVTAGQPSGRYVQLQYGDSPATTFIEYDQLTANTVGLRSIVLYLKVSEVAQLSCSIEKPSRNCR